MIFSEKECIVLDKILKNEKLKKDYANIRNGIIIEKLSSNSLKIKSKFKKEFIHSVIEFYHTKGFLSPKQYDIAFSILFSDREKIRNDIFEKEKEFIQSCLKNSLIDKKEIEKEFKEAEEGNHRAFFIRREKGNGDYVYCYDTLVYNYRGREYEIEDIPAYKQPSFYWKDSHQQEQRRIDSIIEEEERNKNQEYDYKKTADFALDELWAYCEGKPSIYDEE